MSNLDEKLREIVWGASTIGGGMDDFGALPKEIQEEEVQGAVDQIKQAFQDEWYLTPEQKEQTQKLVNQMAQTAQDMAKLPVTVREVGTMTGKEWYERFYAEVKDMSYPEYYKVLEAAKRAGGIDEL